MDIHGAYEGYIYRIDLELTTILKYTLLYGMDDEKGQTYGIYKEYRGYEGYKGYGGI